MDYAWIPLLGVSLPSCSPERMGLLASEWKPEIVELLAERHGVHEIPDDWLLYEGRIEPYSVRDALNRQHKRRQHKAHMIVAREAGPKFVVLWSRQNSGQALAGMQIVQFDHDTGMFEFDIHLYKKIPGTAANIESARKALAEQLYKLVRDSYHAHVWNNGDFVVKPVGGVKSKGEAAACIWRQAFGERIFEDYIQKIKRLYFSSKKKSDERKWLVMRTWCAAALGEVTFARSLAGHTNKKEVFLLACDRAFEAFNTVWSLISAKIESREHRMSRNVGYWTQASAWGALISALLVFLPSAKPEGSWRYWVAALLVIFFIGLPVSIWANSNLKRRLFPSSEKETDIYTNLP